MDSVKNIFAIPELRKRVLFTFGLLAVYRFGSKIPTPGINADALVELAARANAAACKTQQARLEKAVKGAVPAQLIPLLWLHHAAIRQAPIPIRRALRLARSLGVQRDHVESTLFWAAVYGGDVVFEAAVDAAGDVLDAWRSAPT